MELFSTARFAFDDEEWDDMAAAHHAAFHRAGITHSHDMLPAVGVVAAH
ncbi:MAG TPA: hypothetical protein VFV32_06515 [Acidimicrobiales bacterium]|nr:hypothetical protein [Acidimicrobiales bacterium]